MNGVQVVRDATGGSLFAGSGLTPAVLTPVDERAHVISLERLAGFGAEHVFVLDRTGDAVSELTGLWQHVPAVRQGGVYPAHVRVRVQDGGLLACRRVVAALLRALEGGREQPCVAS